VGKHRAGMDPPGAPPFRLLTQPRGTGLV